VPERVALPLRVDQQQVVLHRLPQARKELAVPDPGHLRQQPVRHGSPAAHRRGPQQPLRLRAQRVHPAEQHVFQRRGQAEQVTAAAHRLGQLLDQVGVTAGAVEDGIGHGRRGGSAQDRRELGGDLVPVEPPQCDVIDRAHPLPAGQQRPQPMTPVQLVGAIGSQQQYPRLAQRPDQKGGQI
jgi:hypothetical protein